MKNWKIITFVSVAAIVAALLASSAFAAAMMGGGGYGGYGGMMGGGYGTAMDTTIHHTQQEQPFPQHQHLSTISQFTR